MADIGRMRSLQSPELSKALYVPGFIAWATACVILISLLTSLHDLPLPAIAAGAITQGATLPPAKQWRIVHFLAAACPCSAAVAASLIERGPVPGVDETAVVLDADDAGLGNRLSAAGFLPSDKPADQLAESLNVTGGPMLVIIEPNGKIAYRGGYAAQRPRPGVALQDLTLLAQLRRGEPAPSLPAFGCATSRWLKSRTDPLGLKY